MNEQKALVWTYWQSLNGGGYPDLLSQTLHPDVTWHGFEPLRSLQGSSEVWSRFCAPLLAAILSRAALIWASRSMP